MGTSSLLKRLTPLMAGLLYGASALSAFAEQQSYTVAQIVAYTLRNNGEINALREEKGIRAAGKIRAGLLPNPTLELDGASGALTGSSAESSLSLGLSQEFLLAGKREKRLAIAERELEIYHWQLAERERVLREEVQTATYDTLLAEQRAALADRSIALNGQLLAVTKERLAAGDIPELEMNLVKVELTRSEVARIDVAKILLQSRAKLWKIMGLPLGNQSVSGNLELATILTKRLADLKQLAREQRPDLKALAAEKERDEAAIMLARAEGVPNLTAGLAIKRDATAIEVGGVEGKDTAYTIGLKLSLPIPLFDRNQAGVQEARARRSSAESRLTAAIRNAEQEVETAYASFQHADKILGLYRSSIIPQLEENVKLTAEAYRLGEVGILAVIREQKNFFEVSDGYLTALHDRQTALVKLEAAVATELSGGGE